MSYLKKRKDIDLAIVTLCADQKKFVPKSTRFLVRHSSRSNLLAPLKPCIWSGGVRSKSYDLANGSEAFKRALRLGYIAETEPWAKHSSPKEARKVELAGLGLESSKHEITVFRWIKGTKLLTLTRQYFALEARIRDLLGRQGERLSVP